MLSRTQMPAIVLAALFASPILAKTDLEGCVSTQVVANGGGASLVWYLPDTGECCSELDCGGGRAPPKTDVPGCPQYSGTETYQPTFMPGFTSATSCTASQQEMKTNSPPASTAPASTLPFSTTTVSASHAPASTMPTEIMGAVTSITPTASMTVLLTPNAPSPVVNSTLLTNTKAVYGTASSSVVAHPQTAAGAVATTGALALMVLAAGVALI